MRTVLAYLAFFVMTPLCGGLALLAAFVRVRDREGSLLDLAARWWGQGILRASGVKVVIHGGERRTGRHIYIANHVSRYDVFALMANLHQFKFIAKAELARIPFFGRAARAIGTIYIQRDKRKSAFESYREAATRIEDGASVVVFAEGSRGFEYPLRPFKKGPFVLAISAGAPIIPTVVYGGLHVHPKGTFRVRPGRVDVHFLEPVPVVGLTYDDRDQLAVTVRERIGAVLRDSYGVVSPFWDPRRKQDG
ncbi:MAG TPA: lysophospholipid acyltransferase family protein [Gemmatimonadaceae bacterium]|nr:lysophospholipid acyltransferase family protein [Gemmatimonadaceae bacterium]